LGLQAGVHNLPFIPVLGFLHSDLMKVRRDLKTVRDPYSGNEYVAVLPIMPDVAVIHAARGSRTGEIVTDATRNDRLLAMAARKTIAVVEEIVQPEDLLPRHHEIFVAALHIDAVVLAPGGAHPTACPGIYETDAAHIREYIAASKDEEGFRAYLDKYIFGPPDHGRYLETVNFHGGKYGSSASGNLSGREQP
jgi:glutaconate CoA-transferase subunit A